MRTIRLDKLVIQNFKGLKEFALDVGGDSAVITAANGVGKTTVYDAWLWLLFGKDSTGRAEFEIRPVDENNEAIKGLEVMVEGTLDIDGRRLVFRRLQKERLVKDQVRGYTTDYWIDDVPKKESDYQDYIAELIGENTFKMLTDLAYFNGKLHWTDRRRVLMEVGGDISEPAGFDNLLAALNGRTIEEYAKMLGEQKKAHARRRDEINPRIDEIHKGLESYVPGDAVVLEDKRKLSQAVREGLEAERQRLVGQETQRQATIEQINKLTVKKLHRESQLKSDTGGINAFLEEKADLESKYAEQEQAVNKLWIELRTKENAAQSLEADLDKSMEMLASIRAEYDTADAKPAADTCYACGQKLPADKLAENEQKRKTSLLAITERGNKRKAIVKEQKAALDELRKHIAELTEQGKKAEAELRQAEQDKNRRLAEVDEAIKNRPEADPSADAEWQGIVAGIAKLQAEIGHPVSELLQEIESRKKLAEQELAEVNKSLANADRAKRDRERIDELEQEEKDLAQKVADIDRQLIDIAEYKLAQSRLIEEAVNDKFEHVKFRLFDYLLKEGGIKETCEATYKGVPYSDMSRGEKFYCGIDTINVLSQRYGLSVPLFIDNAKSMTMPIEARSQIIRLCAEKGVKKLQVQVVKAKEKAVA